MATKKRTTGFGFRISPAQKDEALAVLKAYVDERTGCLSDRMNLRDLLTAVTMMDSLYTFKENLSSSIKSPTEKAYDILRFTHVPLFMEDDDVKSVTFEGIGRVNIMDDIQVSTLDKVGLQKWLKSVDLEDIIQPTVNAQTLIASLRKRLKDGKDMPPEDVATVKAITRAQITRSAA